MLGANIVVNLLIEHHQFFFLLRNENIEMYLVLHFNVLKWFFITGISRRFFMIIIQILPYFSTLDTVFNNSFFFQFTFYIFKAYCIFDYFF